MYFGLQDLNDNGSTNGNIDAGREHEISSTYQIPAIVAILCTYRH